MKQGGPTGIVSETKVARTITLARVVVLHVIVTVMWRVYPRLGLVREKCLGSEGARGNERVRQIDKLNIQI